MSQHRADKIHISIHRRTGHRIKHQSLSHAMSYAHGAIAADHVVFPEDTPHVVIDSRNHGDMAFASEGEARSYLASANAKAGYARYTYLSPTGG